MHRPPPLRCSSAFARLISKAAHATLRPLSFSGDMNTAHGGRGLASSGRTSSATAAHPTSQQQWLAQRASTATDFRAPDVPPASLRNSTSFAHPLQQGTRRPAEFGSQPPYAYSPGPPHHQRATHRDFLLLRLLLTPHTHTQTHTHTHTRFCFEEPSKLAAAAACVWWEWTAKIPGCSSCSAVQQQPPTRHLGPQPLPQRAAAASRLLVALVIYVYASQN